MTRDIAVATPASVTIRHYYHVALRQFAIDAIASFIVAAIEMVHRDCRYLPRYMFDSHAFATGLLIASCHATLKNSRTGRHHTSHACRVAAGLAPATAATPQPPRQHTRRMIQFTVARYDAKKKSRLRE